MVADDALMPQCATAHCTYKIAAMLTRETSELTGLDYGHLHGILNICCNCAVVLFHIGLLARIESEIKIFFTFTNHYTTNTTVNMTKVVINILQGSVVD